MKKIISALLLFFNLALIVPQVSLAADSPESNASSFEDSDRKLAAKIAWWKHRFEVDPNLDNMPRQSMLMPLPATLPPGVTVSHQFSIEEEALPSSS